MNEFSGRIAVVTSGGSGMGRRLVAEGCHDVKFTMKGFTEALIAV